MEIIRTTYSVTLAAVSLAAAPLTAQVPDRSKPPELGPPPRLELPSIEEHTLPNGLRIVLMERHSVPLVQVNLLVMAGSAMDPRGNLGLATMTADMLDEGAGTMNALDLADAIDFLGARIGTRAGQHSTTVSLHTPLAQLDDALPLMADIVLRPSFPADELERKRKSRLTALLQAHDQPTQIASALFGNALYGDGHPYGRPSTGDENSIRSYSVTDLERFHQGYFRPNNSALIVVGDVTSEQMLPKLQRAFGDWTAGRAPAHSWPDVRQVNRREILLVDKPGAAQSVIRIGRIGVDRSTPDYYALQVMNTILGGSFTSRLNQNLRERNGYSYGAGSSFSFSPLPGPFGAGASVQTDVTDKALVEFFNELNGILQPIPADEINGAKSYLAFGYPQRFQSVSRVAGNLAQLILYDLPAEYFTSYVDSILAVTVADVQRVARQYVDPERVKIIVVGDRAKIEAGIRALDLGRVRLLSIEDVLGKPPAVEGQ